MMFREVEQVDIAPSIAVMLGLAFTCDGKPIKEVVRYARDCRRVYLVIVDSLGFEEYIVNRDKFPFLTTVEERGYVFRCLSYSYLTTPSIASILCGLRPGKHKVMRTEDAYARRIKCLPEVAYDAGLRVAIVMEEYGAYSFHGLVSLVKPIPDTPDVLEFDETSCRSAIDVLRELDPNLLVIHLRSLDVLGFTPAAMLHVDRSLRVLAESLINETIFFVVGDHPPHDRVYERHVALIVFKVQPKTTKSSSS
ncbi:MAG: hypothetical protein QXO97_08220 [Candidatus Nezhaarchaeales archaeon]